MYALVLNVFGRIKDIFINFHQTTKSRKKKQKKKSKFKEMKIIKKTPMSKGVFVTKIEHQNGC